MAEGTMTASLREQGCQTEKVAAPRDRAIDRLRTACTLLVVAHHSALAYIAFGHFDRQHYLLSSAPIVDAHRWIGFDLFVAFNDAFLMATMFMVAGMVAPVSLGRRGRLDYLKRRVRRLGLPFAFATLFLMPLAYYPSAKLAGDTIGLGAFWWRTITVGPWPSGPPWFLAVLLLFDVIAAAVSRAHPAGGAPIRMDLPVADGLSSRDTGRVVLVAMLAYLPARLAFGGTTWWSFGPFAVQASRLVFYGACFGLGYVLGPRLGGDGTRAALGECRVALALGLAGFIALVAIELRWPDGISREIAIGLVFPATAALLSLSAVTLAGRIWTAGSSWLDRFRPSAYGIYLVHYLPVLWLQYALLPAAWPAGVKAAPVLIGALVLSSATVALARRSRPIRSVL